jgi:glycosyltransferase involved in cell wall biosynthesis
MEHLIDILIPTLPERRTKLTVLLRELESQIGDLPIIILTLEDNRQQTTGAKRNQLIQMATAHYVCFFDDDDWPSIHYIENMYAAALSGLDCASFRGKIDIGGRVWKPFIHSLSVHEWHEADGVYYRYPNHLNLIKRNLAAQIQFPDKTIGEDHEWSTAMHKSGLLKTEYEIEDIIYYYRPSTK